MMDDLKLGSLRILVEVAQLQSVTRAAVSLGLAQSAVSRAVAELERRFGGRLFLRTGRGLMPTDLTLQLMPQVMSLLGAASELDESARHQSAEPAGLVILGMVPAVAGPLGSRLLTVMRQELPQVRLRVLEGYTGEIEDWLASGRVDIGILNRYRRAAQPGQRRLLVSDMHLIGRPQAFARFGWQTRSPTSPASLSLRDVQRCPLVVPSRPNALRSALDEWARANAGTLDVAVEADAYSVIRRLMIDHELFSILPYHAVADELAGGTLAVIRIHERGLRQSVMLVPGSRRPSTQASRAVLQRIPDVARSLIDDGSWRGDG